MSNEEKIEKIKIAIMGMNNAGKTTIIDLLARNEYEMPYKPPDMVPTKGIIRSSEGRWYERNIIVWDFGGQKKFRNQYLNNPNDYFSDISYFYYIVDVQDKLLLQSSIMYFSSIYQKIKKYSPETGIIIVFHKMDPEIKDTCAQIKNMFLEKVQPFLEANGAYFVTCDTSIYDINSLEYAFDQDLKQECLNQ